MKTLLFIFGTRPEAIKLAPIIQACKKNDTFSTRVCITAQHRQMLDPILQFFNIQPDFDLNVMKPNQSLHSLTAAVLLGLDPILTQVAPDLVLVHGDTTTTLSAALAAFYKKIPIVHIEAGLRSHTMTTPWPEEANRVLTDRLATYHFAPTQQAAENLKQEHLAQNVLVTGNTVIDALKKVHQHIQTHPDVTAQLSETLRTLGYPISTRKFILVTGHRRENFGDGLAQCCEAFLAIAQNNPEIDIVYPVHLNPHVYHPVHAKLANIANIYLIPPLDYLPFVFLMSQCHFILTDSGGIQEEAPSLNKPVLVMRETTERQEALDTGTAKLVGTQISQIVSEAQKLLTDPAYYASFTHHHNPYGDGRASDRIVQYLLQKL